MCIVVTVKGQYSETVASVRNLGKMASFLFSDKLSLCFLYIIHIDSNFESFFRFFLILRIRGRIAIVVAVVSLSSYHSARLGTPPYGVE